MRMITRRLVASSVVALGVPAALLAIPAADAVPTPPRQVRAAWHFDGLDESGKVADVSGHSRTLTLAGTWSRVSGAAGTGAVRFQSQSYATVSGQGPASGTQEIAVTAVIRSLVQRPTGDHPNVLQHGRFSDRSQVKMQITKDGTGRASCRFAGARNAVVVTGPSIDVSDGRWHTVTCWRRGSTIGVTVDGTPRTRTRDVGSIDPDRPLTIGDRGIKPGDASDQFSGDVDVVVWAIGDGARTAAASYAEALART